MHILKLILLAALCLPAFATDYNVVGYGGAACDGTTNDTAAFTATYGQVIATKGGRVLVPSGTWCRVENFFMDVTGSIDAAIPVELAADGGGRATLTCQSCPVIVTIGTSLAATYLFNLHKSITNIDFDLSQSSNTSVGAIYARNIMDSTFNNVRFYNGDANRTPKGLVIWGQGSHTCNAASETCHSSGNLILHPYLNGFFYVGIQIDGENTASNANSPHTTIVDGQILRPYAIEGHSCSHVDVNSIGILHRYSDSLSILNTNVEGFDHGMEFAGLNGKVFGGRTECNNVGVYVNDATYPNQFHAGLVGSVHSDGVNMNGSAKVSQVEVYKGSWVQTNLENVRQVRGTSNVCTTTTTQYNRCTSTITFSPALPSSNYLVNCTLAYVSGQPVIANVSNLTTTTFDLTIMNMFSGSTATGRPHCTLWNDNGIGATVNP